MYKIIIQNRTMDWILINGNPERVTNERQFTVLVKVPTHSGDDRIIEIRHCNKLSEAYHIFNQFAVEYPDHTVQRIR